MILRLLLLLFPLVFFSQSKKDQIENLERLLANTKVKKAELEIELDTCNDELDLCNDKAFSLETEKNNIKTELQNRIDFLKIKLDSLYIEIDNYETLIFDVIRLEEDIFFRDSIIQIKDALIESLENKIENQEKGNSVNSDFFITKLYQGDEKINNQTFNLRFEGIVNYERGNVKVLDRYNDWDTENIFNFSRLILVKDLFLKVHSPINKESSWKGSCNCPTNPIVYKKNNYLDGVLPELSFIKGKFVTISNDYKKQNISTDFLFSVGEFEKEDRKYQDKGSYLYDFKYFSFTKEGEDLSESQSFTVPLLVINGRAFLFLNNAIISTLGFGFKFVDSIKCDDGDGDSEGFFEWRYMHDNNEDTDYAERVGWNTCNRTDDYCESNYKGRSNYETRCNRPTLIEVFKKSDYLLDEKKISINSKDYFLFELIEQD